MRNFYDSKSEHGDKEFKTMNKNESKYFYTASLMNQALLTLLEKKDIEFISITELTKKAGVNRTTFYLHYENKFNIFLFKQS